MKSSPEPTITTCIATSVATSIATAMLHHIVIDGHRDWSIPWKRRGAGHPGTVTRRACKPQTKSRVLGSVPVVRMTAVGLENALKRDIVVRPSACHVAVELYTVDVPFMSKIGMSVGHTKLGPPIHRVIAMFEGGVSVCARS